MNTEISNSCQCFGLYDNNNIIGFCGVLHYPHPITTNLKKISRLVILPDYQGIGLGTKFLNVVAKYWSNKGFNVGITTSAKNMIQTRCLFWDSLQAL